MYSTYFNSPRESRCVLSEFYGINHRARISDGEFAGMQNMSSDHFPLLSPRAPRAVLPSVAGEIVTETVTNADGTESVIETTAYENLNGILGDAGFAAVWGTNFYYMGEKIDGLTLIDSEKNMLAMGAYILIYPDAVYYNTVNGEFGEMNSDKTSAAANFLLTGENRFNIPDSTKLSCGLRFVQSGITQTSVTFLGKSLGGGVRWYCNGSVQRGCPKSFTVRGTSGSVYDPDFAMLGDKDGYLYYCSAADIEALTDSSYSGYQYARCEWTKLEISDFKISAEEFGALGFADADLTRIWAGNVHVKIEKNEDGSYSIKNENIADVLTFGSMWVDSQRAPGAIQSLGAWKARTTPVLDYVCVHENRLWGCHFGTQVNSFESVNEIYCSELGDFRKWGTGTAADKAWTASVGAFGKWTGCISHRGYVLFFKEDKILRVSGTKPGNFQYAEISTNGLQAGCERSMAVIDEVLYYKSRNGVYAYDGALPERISDKLGAVQFAKTAAAGGLYGKYFICLDGVLYVYDTANGLWHKEDASAVRFFARYGGALYGAAGNVLICLSGEPDEIFGDAEKEKTFDWYAETGDIGLSYPNQKYFREFVLRMDASAGSRLIVEILSDGSGWQCAADYSFDRLGSVYLPVTAPRCDHMRIRLRGRGEIKIYSIACKIESVSDIPERR